MILAFFFEVLLKKQMTKLVQLILRYIYSNYKLHYWLYVIELWPNLHQVWSR